MSKILDDANLIARQILAGEYYVGDLDFNADEVALLTDAIIHDWQLPINKQPIKWDAPLCCMTKERALKRARDVNLLLV